jgi:hypothetical protein
MVMAAAGGRVSVAELTVCLPVMIGGQQTEKCHQSGYASSKKKYPSPEMQTQGLGHSCVIAGVAPRDFYYSAVGPVCQDLKDVPDVLSYAIRVRRFCHILIHVTAAYYEWPSSATSRQSR